MGRAGKYIMVGIYGVGGRRDLSAADAEEQQDNTVHTVSSLADLASDAAVTAGRGACGTRFS